jgi:hypothetical protein
MMGCAMSQAIGHFRGTGTGYFPSVTLPLSVIIQLVLYVDPLIYHRHHIISAVDSVVKKHT